jgi:hypothetical protein
VVQKVKEISLGDGFGEVAVRANGARVVIHANGTVESRKVDEAASSVGPQVGDPMPDGTIYAGISPNTGTAMYTTPGDEPLTMEWNEAVRYADELDSHRRADWRLPTVAELAELFNNRAAIGGFKESGSNSSDWYWSSTEDPDYQDYARMKRFPGGGRFWNWKGGAASVRPVRSGP